jgi:hypothetical protein
MESTELTWHLPRVLPEVSNPRSFLDHVHTIMKKLWPNEEFYKYINGVTNKSAITGNFLVDRGFAAQQISDVAKEEGITDVATCKLSKIMRAIETVLRKPEYRLGRKERLANLKLLEAQVAQQATQEAQVAAE